MNIRFFLLYIISLLLIIKILPAQTGSEDLYNFTKISPSSRVSALGGNSIAIKDKDNSIALMNPSLITENLNNALTMSYIDYFGDINYANMVFSKSFSKLGNYNFGIRNINYGDFTYADEAANRYGEFSAKEYSVTLGWGKQLSEHFTIGSNLNNMFSSLEKYNSYAIGVDVAGSYFNADNDFTASLLFRNMGSQITTYTGVKEAIPFEIMAGISKGLEHVPFRYILTYTHLEKFDLTYDDTGENIDESITGEEDGNKQSKVEKIADNFMRHIIIGGEFSPSQSFSLRLGYNYKRRQELKVESKISLVGFSGGIEIKISKFRIGYSRSSYHLAGALNQFTLSTNLFDFMGKNHDVM